MDDEVVHCDTTAMDGEAVHGPGIGSLCDPMPIDGEAVNNVRDFDRIMTSLKVQQTIKLSYIRGEQTKEVSVLLEGI